MTRLLDDPQTRARLRRADPVVDAAINSLGCVADVVGGEGLIQGLAVNVRLPRSESAITLWVPRAAFPAESNLVLGDTDRLLVVEGEICTERMVMVSAVEGDQVGVSAGLAVGDQVILAPTTDLRVGDAVKCELTRDSPTGTTRASARDAHAPGT